MAANKYAVTAPGIDWSHPKAPESLSYSGFEILVNGVEIGRVQSYQETGVYARTVTPVRELSAGTFGRVVDMVPGINEHYQMSLQVVEISQRALEIALGYSARWLDLLDQKYPFAMTKRLRLPPNIYSEILWDGIWVTGAPFDGWSSDGDAIVRRTLECVAVSKTIITGGL